MRILIYPNKPYKCWFCGKKKTIPYAIVDGGKSCQKCNREYDQKPHTCEVKCPTCEGTGKITGCWI